MNANDPGALARAEAGIGIAERRSDPHSTPTGVQPVIAAKRMVLRSWRPMQRNSLRGFAFITLPIGLDIDDVAVHVAGGRAWARLPGKPMVDADGRALRDDKGKVRYALPNRWSTQELGRRFSERVVELVRAACPGALSTTEVQHDPA